MTKVSYIHGVQDSSATPKGQAQRRFIDFRDMTDGELRLSLIAEQFNIMAEYYGKDEYRAAEQRVLAAIKSGIHGHRSIGMIPGPLGQAIAKEINRAKRMTRPAAGVRLQRDMKSGIGAPLIPLEDCDELLEWDEDRYTGQPIQVQTAESRACEERNDNVRLLNQHLEPSAHHLLYEYLGGTDNATVIAKRVLHRNAISKLADLTKLDRSNMRLWLRNGVLRNNVEHGAPPMQPEAIIQLLKEDGQSRVSGLQVIAAIIGAVAAAIAATTQLVQSLQAQKRQELLLSAQGIGTPTFGPEQADWDFGTGTGTPPGTQATNLFQGDMTPLLLGGAALLLLK